jgi:hypothetical protein
VYESTGLDKGKPLKKSLIQLQPARDLNPEPPEFEPDALIYASTVLGFHRRLRQFLANAVLLHKIRPPQDLIRDSAVRRCVIG